MRSRFTAPSVTRSSLRRTITDNFGKDWEKKRSWPNWSNIPIYAWSDLINPQKDSEITDELADIRTKNLTNIYIYIDVMIPEAV